MATDAKSGQSPPGIGSRTDEHLKRAGETIAGSRQQIKRSRDLRQPPARAEPDDENGSE